MARKITILLFVLLIVSAALAASAYRIERAKCVGCGDCDRICPVDAVEIVDGKAEIDPEICISCGFCQGVCTHDAVR